ncbi:hypothetical protein C2E23DRAFT_751794 [Lenzites betulinus]|nr:hypothetical protein C2E23DRAFT_751794 [Lenzites betulinus]
MPETITTAPRVVPGAPPPPAPSKTQKKKRKGGKGKDASESDAPVAVPDTTTAALIDHAPEESDIKEGVVAPQLVAQASTESHTPVGLKATPIVDMLNKRLKANGKKITRIQTYQNESPEKLNDDQRRLLKTLPTLEAVSKELEEVKKAIEVHEAEVAQELAFIKAEASRAESQRIRDAVAAAEAEYLDKTAELLTFLRLHAMLSSHHPDAVALNLSEAENLAVYSITETLSHERIPGKTDIIRAIFSGEGEHLDIPYSRILEIKEQFLNPPPQKPTEPEEEIEEAPAVSEETPTSVTGVPSAISTIGGINFILTDELAEAETENVQDSGEWVDVQAQPEPEQPAEVEITETVVTAEVNGHAVVEESVTITTTTEVSPSGPINWADEEDHNELPPLANLQAHYGTSGEASPALEAPEADGAVPETPGTPHANGQGALIDEEGFTHHHRGRGRGRGGHRGGEHGGHRGGERGGFRGGFRGGERGGPRGGFRGGDGERGGRGSFRGGDGERGGRGHWRGGDGERGGFRGGDGERGGFRGGDGERGGFRGGDGERGGFRGGDGERGGFRGGKHKNCFRGRSDGDWRGGRGTRGRGRGFHEPRGGAPPA